MFHPRVALAKRVQKVSVDAYPSTVVDNRRSINRVRIPEIVEAAFLDCESVHRDEARTEPEIAKHSVADDEVDVGCDRTGLRPDAGHTVCVASRRIGLWIPAIPVAAVNGDI